MTLPPGIAALRDPRSNTHRQTPRHDRRGPGRVHRARDRVMSVAAREARHPD